MTLAAGNFLYPQNPLSNIRWGVSLALSLGLHLGLVWFVSHQEWVVPTPKKPIELVFELEASKPLPKPVPEPSLPEKKIEKPIAVPQKMPVMVQHQKITPVPAKQAPVYKPKTAENTPVSPKTAFVSKPVVATLSVPTSTAGASSEHQPVDAPHTSPASPAVSSPSEEHPATAPVSRPAPSRSNAIPTWKGKLLGRLESRKRYPKIARELRQQGVAYLRFAMDRRGRLLGSQLEKSSGVQALDEETLALARRAEPFPSPPSEMTGERIELVVPIQFFLK